jgi:tRNA pseudouridine13 synthase
MYKIKQIPEDFIVEEINSFKFNESGKYSVVLMEKREYNTVKAISIVAGKFHLNMKDVGFAGNKDRNAITYQYISLYNVPKKRIDEFETKDIKLTYKGKIDDRINLGDLEGNKFTITIRNLDNDFKIDKSKLERIPNYFGEQRFSTNNADVGKAILLDDFKKAIELILEFDGDNESKMKDHLLTQKNDYVGAFKILPKKIQQIYIHAYQSYLWNKAVDIYLKQNSKSKNIDFPLIGFDNDFEDDDIEEIYDDLLDEEKVTYRDFVIRKLPYLTVEGSTRKLFLEVSDFSSSKLENDDLNSKGLKNKKKIVLQFQLKKGSYATTLIKYLCK